MPYVRRVCQAASPLALHNPRDTSLAVAARVEGSNSLRRGQRPRARPDVPTREISSFCGSESRSQAVKKDLKGEEEFQRRAGEKHFTEIQGVTP